MSPTSIFWMIGVQLVRTTFYFPIYTLNFPIKSRNDHTYPTNKLKTKKMFRGGDSCDTFEKQLQCEGALRDLLQRFLSKIKNDFCEFQEIHQKMDLPKPVPSQNASGRTTSG